jgi:hypothetical protein
MRMKPVSSIVSYDLPTPSFRRSLEHRSNNGVGGHFSHDLDARGHIFAQNSANRLLGIGGIPEYLTDVIGVWLYVSNQIQMLPRIQNWEHIRAWRRRPNMGYHCVRKEDRRDDH